MQGRAEEGDAAPGTAGSQGQAVSGVHSTSTLAAETVTLHSLPRRSRCRETKPRLAAASVWSRLSLLHGGGRCWPAPTRRCHLVSFLRQELSHSRFPIIHGLSPQGPRCGGLESERSSAGGHDLVSRFKTHTRGPEGPEPNPRYLGE